MKKLLATLGLLAIATPASLSFTTINSNKINYGEQHVFEATIEEEIVAAVKANINKIDDKVTVEHIVTINEFKEAVDTMAPIIMAFVLPKDLLDEFNPDILKINSITLDGQEPTDEILKVEDKKIVEFNFDYGSVKNENVSFSLIFNFE